MPRRIEPAIALCALLATLGPSAEARPKSQEKMDPYAALVVAADAAHQRYRLVTDDEPGISEERAYDLQRQVVRAKLAKGDAIAGFKAGLMSASSQKMRQANGPIFGVLLRSGAARAPARMALTDFRSMVLECEIGFVFARSISRPVGDVTELRKAIRAVTPAIEVPDVAYTKTPYSVRDMIAANVSAARFITGTPIAVAKAGDLNRIEAVLTMNGQEIARAPATQALGDQWKALQATVNLAVGQGYVIKPGQVIITGALALRTDVQPGQYQADYGPLGKLSFTIAH